MLRKIILIIVLASYFWGCERKCNVNEKVYEVFFENLVRMSLVTVSPDENEDIVGDELDLLKTELKKIKFIKRYSSKPNYGGIFRTTDYRLIFLFVKQKNSRYKVMEILYSTRDKILLIRENDLFPNKAKFPKNIEEDGNINVFEFEISERANQLIKIHESKLSSDGLFIHTWPEQF